MTQRKYGTQDGFNRLTLAALAVMTVFTLMLGSAAAQEDGNQGKVSVGAGIDFASQYFFRGIIQETEGAIAQPYLEAGIALGDYVTVTGGIWNSLHSGPTGSDGPGDPAMWYESDFYASAGFALSDAWSADVTYTGYTSPNGTFGTVKELSTGIAYDDGLFGPYATFAFELDGQADGGLREGNYLEIGAGPGLALGDSPVGLSFPVAIGLSMKDYYEVDGQSDTFGFFQFGAIASVALPMPVEYGSWELSGGINFLTFGDALKSINGADDGFQPIGVFGLSLGY